MVKKLIVLSMFLSFSIALAFSSGQKEKGEELVYYTFGGSSTVAPIVNAAISGFEKNVGNVKITYETTGSSVGIKNLISNTFSLAGASRNLKESEIDKGCRTTTIALDGLTVAVNESVDVSNLSMIELANIFSGNITNWKDVGGKDLPIELVVRDETSGTYGTFTEIVLEKNLGKGTKQSKKAIVAKENGEVATKIASTPGAIGYIGMGFDSIVTNKGGKLLSIDEVNPTIRNVINKTYPISRELFIVTLDTLKDNSIEKSFIDYLLSEKGQSIVEEKQFIPVF